MEDQNNYFSGKRSDKDAVDPRNSEQQYGADPQYGTGRIPRYRGTDGGATGQIPRYPQGEQPYYGGQPQQGGQYYGGQTPYYGGQTPEPGNYYGTPQDGQYYGGQPQQGGQYYGGQTPYYGGQTPDPNAYYGTQGGTTGQIPRYGAQGGTTGQIPRYGAQGGATGQIPRYGAQGGATGRIPRYGADGGATGRIPRYSADSGTTGTTPRIREDGTEATGKIPRYREDGGATGKTRRIREDEQADEAQLFPDEEYAEYDNEETRAPKKKRSKFERRMSAIGSALSNIPARSLLLVGGAILLILILVIVLVVVLPKSGQEPEVTVDLSPTPEVSITPEPTPEPTEEPTPTPHPLSTPLQWGMDDPIVAEIQERLVALGYMDIPKLDDGSQQYTTRYGTATKAAVRSFQAKNGLDADGWCGDGTYDAMMAENAKAYYIERNDEGDQVSTLQTRLKELGFLATNATGHCGESTVLAVQKFQQKNGLDADGKAGQQTLAALYGPGAIASDGSVKPFTGALSNGATGLSLTTIEAMNSGTIATPAASTATPNPSASASPASGATSTPAGASASPAIGGTATPAA